MPYALGYNEIQQIIELVPTGNLTSENIRNGTDEFIALCAERDTNRILIDASDVETVSCLADFYDQPQWYAEGGLSRNARIALVMTKTIAAQEYIRFYDNVCYNRGWLIQLFETRDAAVEWLTSGESP